MKWWNAKNFLQIKESSPWQYFRADCRVIVLFDIIICISFVQYHACKLLKSLALIAIVITSDSIVSRYVVWQYGILRGVWWIKWSSVRLSEWRSEWMECITQGCFYFHCEIINWKLRSRTCILIMPMTHSLWLIGISRRIPCWSGLISGFCIKSFDSNVYQTSNVPHAPYVNQMVIYLVKPLWSAPPKTKYSPFIQAKHDK